MPFSGLEIVLKVQLIDGLISAKNRIDWRHDANSVQAVSVHGTARGGCGNPWVINEVVRANDVVTSDVLGVRYAMVKVVQLADYTLLG